MGPYAAQKIIEALKDRPSPLSLDLSCNYFLLLDRLDLFPNAAVRVHGLKHRMESMLFESGLISRQPHVVEYDQASFTHQIIHIRSAKNSCMDEVIVHKKLIENLKQEAASLAKDSDDVKKKETDGKIGAADVKLKGLEGRLLLLNKIMKDYQEMLKFEKERLDQELKSLSESPQGKKLVGKHT